MTYIPIPQPLTTTLIPTGGKSLRRYARNNAVGTVYEVIDATGGTSPDIRTTAATLQIVSTSAEDSAAGTGARTVTLSGLNANFDPIDEVVTMNGLTAVTTVNAFIRLNLVQVTTVGTYGGLPGGGGVDGGNIGVLTVNYTGSATIVHTVRAQDGREFSSVFTVPRGYYAGITLVNTSVDSGKTCDLNIQVRPGANIVSPPFSPTLLAAELIGTTTGIQSNYNPELILQEMTDIWVLGRSSQGSSVMTFTIGGYIAPNA